MTEPLSIFSEACRFQGRLCEAFGSPFSAAVLDVIADDVGQGGPFARLAAPWSGADVRRITADAAALRLLGGLHYLVLSGAAPNLAALYPPTASAADRDRLAGVIPQVANANLDFLTRFITSPPQTNEVSRSKCLAGGFLTVAAETGLPLRCLEIGSSAGLNQNWDLYRYAFDGAWNWGDPAAPVRFGAGWTGGAPQSPSGARVAERRGCDQNPIDIADPEQALRLQAYVWPDQAERLGNLRAAIDLARQAPPTIERADAAAWAQARATPAWGLATVIFHSVVWQYLAPETRESLRATIAAAGASATPESPFAWLRMEPSPTHPAGMQEVRLTLWPGGDDRLLALAHPHGATVEWLD